jgi:uncharacterized protein (DUF983 family)
MNNNPKIVVSSTGIGFLGFLFIVFFVLKMTNYISWSWIWVTAPLWIPVAGIFSILLVLALIVLIGSLFTRSKNS